MGHSEDDIVHKIPKKKKWRPNWQNQLKILVLVKFKILQRIRYITRYKAKKKKTSLFPVAGLKIAMRNAVFFFFYTSWKSNAQCGFCFFKQNFRKKIHQNNSFGFFSTFIKNITSFISKWFMWPFLLHALGASLMNFLPWPKLHHIWKKIQSKCTECM